MQIWGLVQSQEDVWKVFQQFILRTVKHLPWCETGIEDETNPISPSLLLLNQHGFLTINSQVCYQYQLMSST